MRSLAVFLRHNGDDVAGCDASPTDLEFFKERQIEVEQKFSKKRIESADVVVYSSAIGENDRGLRYAKSLGKKMIVRGALLGEIASGYQKVVAVAGAHGKTTTTALIYNILKPYNPTLHLGGVLVEEKAPYVLGGKEYFVTEACEYHNNFLYLKPYVAVVTNIEKEHMDFFKTFENEKNAFQKFKDGAQFVVEGDGGYVAKNIRHVNQKLCFDVCLEKEKIMSLKMKIVEEVNAQNALFALRTCKLLGLSDEEIKNGLESFEGVQKRFESVVSPIFEKVIVDYAHHPTEIRNTIMTAKKLYEKVFFIFQPHTFSRTKALFCEFVEVFKEEKNLAIFKTFPAREKRKAGVSGKSLAKILGCNYFNNVNKLVKFLIENFKGYALVFMGAGDLPKILESKNIVKNS